LQATRVLKNQILDVYLPLFEPNDIDLEFLYGTRDTGKSKAGAQLAVFEWSKTKEDFSCLLVRKVKATIKGTIYANVKSIIKEWQLSNYFHSIKSPLEISSKINNGIFTGHGFDDGSKVKSMFNPTMALVEEGDQLSQEDFMMILTTVRHNYIKTKVVFMFNPEMPKGIDKKEEWWLWQDWFSHTNEKSFTNTKLVEYIDDDGNQRILKIKYRAIHSTFDKNPYCPPVRKAMYHLLKKTNPAKWLPYAKGEWGIREIKSPAIVTFNSDKHVGKVEIVEGVPLLFWLDFNVDPLACTVWQIYRENGVHKIRGVREIKIKAKEGVHNTQQLIDFIKLNYSDKLHSICFSGDATGNMGRSEGLSNWIQINNVFTLGRRLQVPKSNPNVNASIDLMNYIFYNHPDLLIDSSMETTIFELKYTERDDKGLIKDKRSEATQKADFLDTVRYGFNYHFLIADDIQKYPSKFGIK